MSQDPNLERKGAASSQPTSKEVTLKKDIENLRTKNNEKEAEIKKLKLDNRQLQLKVDNLEKTNVKNSQKLDQEKKIRATAVTEKENFEAVMEKMQLAVSSRLELLGVDFDKVGSIADALDAAFNAINKLATDLQEKETLIIKLQEEQTNMKSIIEKQKAKLQENELELDKQKQTISSQTKQIEEYYKLIDGMKQTITNLTNQNQSLTEQVNQLSSNIAQQKQQSITSIDEMSKKMFQLLDIHVEKDLKIQDLEKRLKHLEPETLEQKNIILQRSQTVDNLTEDLNSKKDQINTYTNEIEKLTQRVKELETIMSIPKFDQMVQTDITGAIDQQISDYPRLLKEIVALKHAIGERNDHIANLGEENSMLLVEIDELLKKAARFYPCKTNHTGEICIMRAHPKRYLVATGSTDLSCRLWRIDPDSSKRKAVVVQRAIIDGQLDAIAFSDDGTLLAAGTGYNDGPDGYVIIWSVNGSFLEGIVLHAIRSRPTVRFGRVKSIAFSADNKFVYCGDTTGSVCCFNVEEEKLVAVIQSHHDVVYDVAISTNSNRHALYSVSHDQSLCAFDLPSSIGGLPTDSDSSSLPSTDNNNNNNNDDNSVSKNNKQKNQQNKKNDKNDKSIDLTENRNSKDVAKRRQQLTRNISSFSVQELLANKLDNVQKFQSTVIQKDNRYPFWRIAISSNGKYVCCASRKVNIFFSTDKSATDVIEGPRITDADSDHVRTLRICDNLLLVSRTSVARIKLFDLKDGKEIKIFGCKKPVSQADFLCDNKHIIICQQEIKQNELPKPCIMKIVAHTSNSKVPSKMIPKEPTTPRDDDDDETGIQAESQLSPKQIEIIQKRMSIFGSFNDNDNKEKGTENVKEKAIENAKEKGTETETVKEKGTENTKEKGTENAKEKGTENGKDKEVILAVSLTNNKNTATKQQSLSNINVGNLQANNNTKNTKKSADKNI